MEKPRLRPVQAFPVDYQGKRYYGLRDPQNLATGPIVLEPEVFFIISLFDGTHSLVEIQAAYTRKFGDLLYSERLSGIINDLDRNFFLESENFVRYVKQLTEEFQKAKERPASHAGRAYPEDPKELRNQIDEFFASLSAGDGEGEADCESASSSKKVKGLIAPHIDFSRGGPCFAQAYRELKGGGAELYVILGTAHGAQSSPFILTDKDFQTPFGRMQADTEFIRAFRERCGSDWNEEEFLHRDEHSIEFQVIFLQYLLSGKKQPRVVPILCGPYLESMKKGISPWEVLSVQTFLRALQDELAACGKEWCIIAGADLAHIGPQFGAPRQVAQADLELLEREDREMLALVEKGDADAFSQNILKDRDKRNVCGYPPIFAMLKVLGDSSGKLLQYDFAADPNGTVSFAALAYYG